MYFTFPFSAVRGEKKHATTKRESLSPYVESFEIWVLITSLHACSRVLLRDLSLSRKDFAPCQSSHKVKPSCKKRFSTRAVLLHKRHDGKSVAMGLPPSQVSHKGWLQGVPVLVSFPGVLWHLQRGRQKSLLTAIWECSWYLAHSTGLCTKQSEMELLCQWSLWTASEELKFELQVQVL